MNVHTHVCISSQNLTDLKPALRLWITVGKITKNCKLGELLILVGQICASKKCNTQSKIHYENSILRTMDKLCSVGVRKIAASCSLPSAFSTHVQLTY